MYPELHNIVGSKALVTGATGFTGRHLTFRLLELGSAVTVLVRKSSAETLVAEFVKRGAKVVYGDVRDPLSLREATRGVDYVFHLAALYRQARFPDKVYFDVNLGGTANVLDAACELGVKRVIHCSTCGVHGSIPDPPASEEEPFRPCDVYQESKAEAEKLARERFRSGALEGVIIRPAMIWGEGDARILKLFRGVAKRRFPLIGSGNQLTHWLYIEDLVDGFLLAADRAEAKNQVYILAGRRPITLNETIAIIARLAGTKPLPFKLPFGPVYLTAALIESVCKPLGLEPPLYRRRVEFFEKNRAYDTTKARTELGFCPRYDIEEEARRIFTWYKEHGWLD